MENGAAAAVAATPSTSTDQQLLSERQEAATAAAAAAETAVGATASGATAAVAPQTSSPQTLQPCALLPKCTTPFDTNCYNQTFISVMNSFERTVDNIRKNYAHEVDEIEVVYECDFEKRVKTPGTKEYQFFQSSENLNPQSKKPPPMAIRDSLRGSCEELMSLAAEATESHESVYQDINR